eukprot:CAMPEP_0170455822 /NCGR_PEP_ID=MMETSP0123-20130129/3654_1 /TAXON_ID=182087 /ORGANISM="Favella ehrenbergii, Strain Fehren 1" /LENGTH=81 /DNA_ID=CAMNT_0010719079 /DNA_START=274 /DNA_END=519 /DNA_ORIENTATION=-
MIHDQITVDTVPTYPEPDRLVAHYMSQETEDDEADQTMTQSVEMLAMGNNYPSKSSKPNLNVDRLLNPRLHGLSSPQAYQS